MIEPNIKRLQIEDSNLNKIKSFYWKDFKSETISLFTLIFNVRNEMIVLFCCVQPW